jgi:NADH-quinone oxidoreductase subunit H
MEDLLRTLLLDTGWQFTAARGLILILIVMTIAGYSVLLERKASAWIQGRIGPNRTNHPLIAWIPGLGNFLMKGGFIQPAADGLKFLFKEDALPGHVRKTYYVLAPIVALAPALIVLIMLPFGTYTFEGKRYAISLTQDADVGVLFMFAVSSLGVYGIALAGWSANSKFPFLGAVRGSAQLISYELAMGLSVLTVFLATSGPGQDHGLSLVAIVDAQAGAWNILYHPVAALVFLISIFAETNRHPFDMPESETDLVGGFHTEYGAFKFGLFFVAEYGHMVIGSSLFILMFLGGWHVLPWVPTVGAGAVASLLGVAAFFAKLCFFLFFFVWVRWTIPRFRYDQVMRIGWRVLLPVAILNLLVYFLYYALTGAR